MGYLIIPEGSTDTSTGHIVNDIHAAIVVMMTLNAKGLRPKVYQEVDPAAVPDSFRGLTAVPQQPAARGPGQRQVLPTLTMTETTPPAAPTRSLFKRGPNDLDRLRTQILSWVVRNVGQSVTEISDGIGVPVKDLILPIRQLIEDKKLTKKGNARASKYFPPRVGPAAAAPTKAKRAA